MLEMLTVRQTAERLKSVCPNVHIGENAIRKWEKEKRFYSVKVGRKTLISWLSFSRFLSGEEGA